MEKIISEAEGRLHSLKETAQRRREWYQDLKTRIADRQSEHIALITSISAAVLALSVSFSSQRSNIWVEISFWSLMFTALIGTILILLLISLDKGIVDNDRKEEQSVFTRLIDSTEKLIENPTSEQYIVHQNDFKEEEQKIVQISDKYESERWVLGSLYILVLLTFIVGILSLVGAWIMKPSGVEIGNIVNFTPLVFILLFSIVLGIIKFGSLETSQWRWQLKFAEIWNDFVNFFVAGLVGYYFVLVRLPLLSDGDPLNSGDFLLLVILLMGLFGHLCVLSKNITEGVEAILGRVLDRK